MTSFNTQPNIRAAIERSRRSRKAFQRRRRHLLFVVSTAVAAALPLSLSVLGVTGSDVVHAASSGAQNLADLLAQRSPGERTAATLTKTKKAQHALVRSRFPEGEAPTASPVATELAKLLLPPVEQPPLLVPGAPLLAEAKSAALATFFAAPAGGSIGSPPAGTSEGPSTAGGGGSLPGGGTPGTFTPTTPPREVVPSAVPEPASWAMMLIGFAMLGCRGRRTSGAPVKARRL